MICYAYKYFALNFSREGFYSHSWLSLLVQLCLVFWIFICQSEDICTVVYRSISALFCYCGVVFWISTLAFVIGFKTSFFLV